MHVQLLLINMHDDYAKMGARMGKLTKKKILEEINSLIEKGNLLFNTNAKLDELIIADIIEKPKTGKVVAMARRTVDLKYSITISKDAILSDRRTILLDILPHEVAHIICMTLEAAGNQEARRPHGKLWRRVCKALGGSGKAFVPFSFHTRGSPEYLYATSKGRLWYVSPAIHKSIQDYNRIYRTTDNDRIQSSGFIKYVI